MGVWCELNCFGVIKTNFLPSSRKKLTAKPMLWSETYADKRNVTTKGSSWLRFPEEFGYFRVVMSACHSFFHITCVRVMWPLLHHHIVTYFDIQLKRLHGTFPNSLSDGNYSSIKTSTNVNHKLYSFISKEISYKVSPYLLWWKYTAILNSHFHWRQLAFGFPAMGK